jgi:hypothetical protein
MNSALQLLNEFEAVTADGFPLGKPGAEVLGQLERITKLVEEAKSYYKAALTKNPRSIPGWALKPGAVRRSLGDPAKVWDRLSDTLSVEQFMVAVKLEVGRLQDQWARVNGVAPSNAKAAFNAVLGDLITEFQNAPSLIKFK